jgi:hypothetical protein
MLKSNETHSIPKNNSSLSIQDIDEENYKIFKKLLQQTTK